MDLFLIIFFVGIAFLLGYSISYVHLKKSEKLWNHRNSLSEKEINDLHAQIKVLQQANTHYKDDYEEAKRELALERNNALDLNRKLSYLESDYKNLQEKLINHKNEVEKLQEKFSHEFKNLANDIFEEKSKRFTDQNKNNISELLTPLKDRIVEFEKKLDVSSKESLTWNASLREQISGLKELNLQITKEAENLTKALKGDNKAQGNWGEFILESILEKSGLARDREYFVQECFKSEDGKRFQPDIIIKLPEDKNIIIDAKVSLLAYERYHNCESDEERSQCIKNHLLSLKTHIKSLGEKNYQKLHGIKGLDFVLMFIPIEPALSLAIQQDTYLFNNAFEKNIVIVSPSTLLATLRTISSIWKQEYQNRNAMEIARQSGNLYDKFVGFVQDLNDLGSRIASVRDVYDKAMNKLVSGKGNLVGRAEKIRNLGAGASKTMPQDLLEKADEVGE
jgi:DNA recombination protein RmuC